MRQKGITVLDSKPVVVSQGFVDDFELVAAHYELKKHGEYDLAKDLARKDLDNAIVCYAEMAKQIRESA